MNPDWAYGDDPYPGRVRLPDVDRRLAALVASL